MLLVVAAAHEPLLVSEGVLNTMENQHPALGLPDYDGCIAADASMLEAGAVNAQGPFMSNLDKQRPPVTMGFECTRARLRELLRPQYPPQITSFIGQFRAAIANFLFQNKMKAEYPDDFQALLYPASAAQLDAALTPLSTPSTKTWKYCRNTYRSS